MTTKIFPILLLGLTALAAGPLAPPAMGARGISIVMEAQERSGPPVLEALREALGGRIELSVRELGARVRSDPLEKGRFLASLQKEDLVISVGDGATSFLLEELEGTPVFFVGASEVPGPSLVSGEVSGILCYNTGRVLDLVKEISQGPLGLIYTPGYEPVVEWIQGGARERGVTVQGRRVDSLKEIPPVLRQLKSETRYLWVLGDPLLNRGPGSQFLVEWALSRGMAIVAAGRGLVKQGALLCMLPDARAVAAQAALVMKEILDKDLRLPSPRIRESPFSGSFLFNAALAEKWNIRISQGVPWRPSP